MQKTINIILKAALAVVLTVLATGCITDKFDTSKDLRSVMLQVKIATGEMTKAAPTGAESAINSVRIYAYRADGLQAGHFYRPDASTDPIVMDLTLPETGTHNVKFYVIANEASMDFMDDFRFEEDMTQAQLMAAKFHNVIPSNGFPMYCEQTEDINVESVTQTPNTLENHKGHFYLTKEVTFSLVRPMAKLSVYAAIAQGGSSQPISVRGLAYQKNGTRNHNYLLPQTAATLATVPERTRGADMISQSIILTKTVEKTNETVLQTPESYDLIVKDHYIGETEVGGEDWTVKVSDRQAVLHVQYAVGEGGELKNGYVYLPAIVRNTHYKVLILINSDGQIIINYQVAEWDDADVTNLVFDYPTHTYVRVATNEEDKPATQAEMSELTPFTGYFKMSYPASDKWTPVLLSGSEECEMKIYKEGESTPATLPVSASDDWYRIEVKPKVGSALTAGDEVELAITYAPNYMDGVYDYLMINGSQSNPYWPTAPERHDPNKIIITVK